MMQASATHPSSSIPPETGSNFTGTAARVALRFFAMMALVIALLFLPAGTLRWWQGWALLAVYLASGLSAFLFFAKTDPQIVKRRLQTKEPVPAQRRIIHLGYPLFALVLTLPGFDHRFAWSQRWLGPEPTWLEVLSLAMVPLAMLAVAWVISTNHYAGRTIRVEQGQTVITRGPYRVVRHPMYAFSLVLFTFVPLALGSYVTLPTIPLTLLFYLPRLLNEEKVLRAQLPGYTEYCRQTRWHLVPLIW